MKKVSVITLTFVMLINSGAVFSAPKKRRAGSVGINTSRTINVNESEAQNTVEEIIVQEKLTENNTELKELLANLQTDMEKAKSSCVGIKDDLKTIQVLAGVSTGASSLGTLTSGGALATGIMKAKTDKKLNDLSNMSSFELYEYAENLESIIKSKNEEKSKLEKKSKTLGNIRTGLLAGTIATSATSTITSGISIKKLDDLISKMKDCDRAVNNLKANVNNAEAEEIGTDLTSYKNITQSCTGFDTNNIKDIKGVMTASTIVGGVGTVAGTVGTITSAVANTEKTREEAKSTEEGRVKAKALNMTANISAGIATGTSAGGIVLGAVTLSKLSKNVDVAEKCEDALK